MFRSSFPIGRFMGVELRIHASLPALLALAIVYARLLGSSTARGFGLCFALLFAIVVREAARTLAAAWNGLHLRALLIFPVGGIMAFASANDSMESATQLITFITPLANFLAGLLLLGFSYGIDPHVQLFAQPWIDAGHILRSVVWTQFVLGAVSLLPVAALTSRRLNLPQAGKEGSAARRAVPFLDAGTFLAFALMIAGLAVKNLWLFVFGVFLMLTTRLRASATPPAASDGTSVLVRDAMQTDYTLMSSSDTFRSALQRSVGSSQEIFPVLRGDRLVGSVTRDTLTAHLQAEGDSYVQGAMTRNLPIASPDEPLTAALRRSASSGSGDLIAVTEGPALVGILTQQGILRAMQRTAAIPQHHDAERGE